MDPSLSLSVFLLLAVEASKSSCPRNKKTGSDTFGRPDVRTFGPVDLNERSDVNLQCNLVQCR